jgi:hypothetical protein
MGVAAERAPEVAGDGADVAALAADHLEFGMVGVGAGQERQAFDPERAGGEVHLLALAGADIGAFAVDLHRRELRRDLEDVAFEGGSAAAISASAGRSGLSASTSPSASSVFVACPKRTVKR